MDADLFSSYIGTSMRLKIQLPSDWGPFENATDIFYRLTSKDSGALQLSFTEYKSGEIPNPTPDDLKRLAVESGNNKPLGEVVESSAGPCVFGAMGTAVFRAPEHARFQIWFLSNGGDFITATHVCIEEPDPKEVAEAQQIVCNLTLGPDQSTLGNKSPWKFW
jgi:hypothetical protein